jgi:esterase/lipase superfamily enzyme
MYAALFALKWPERFGWALCMSGRYQTAHFLPGLRTAQAWYNNPLAFVPGLEGEALDRARKTHLVLVCGRGTWEEGCIEETIELADVCKDKGIPHTRDIWGADVSHDWAWWRRQALFHLARRFGG